MGLLNFPLTLQGDVLGFYQGDILGFSQNPVGSKATSLIYIYNNLHI